MCYFFFFSSRRRHTRWTGDWSSDVCSSDLFRVDLSDALASARSLAPFVDSANPDASRILEKPLMLVPHGGGLQLTAGSTEEQNLRQWVHMVAAAACN